MNYGRFNNIVAYSDQVSLEAKGLYAIICSLCGNKSYCFPSLSTLSTLTGKSKSTVQRLLKELTEKGVIERCFDTSLRKTTTINLMDGVKKI